MKYAPLARVVLRYIVGAGVFGSKQVGNQLAADPDLVVLVSFAIGAVVEVYWYLDSRRKR